MLFRFRKAKAVRAGIVAPSHLLLKFGKLTTKFELLCKETKSPQLQNFVGEARDTRGERVVWRAVGRARKSKRATADRDRYGVREWMRGAVRESLAASGRRLSGAHGRRRYTALEIRCFAEKQSLNVLFLSSANRHQSSASFPHFAFPKPSPARRFTRILQMLGFGFYNPELNLYWISLKTLFFTRAALPDGGCFGFL